MWKKEKKAFKQGKRIQYRAIDTFGNITDWLPTKRPVFTEYRIHPEDIEPIIEWHDKLVVHCKTRKQMEKVIELQPKVKGKLHCWDFHKQRTAITNKGRYARKKYYKELGLEVIKAKEFLKRYKPKKKEIEKEPLEEGEWAAFWDKACDYYHIHKYHCFDNRYSQHVTKYGSNYDFALPISVGHEAIVEAMEETNNA